MQTKRPARNATERTRNERPGPSVVLWRPDIVLASGAMLVSLAERRETAVISDDSGTLDARPSRDRLAPMPSIEILTRSSIHFPIDVSERGWR